MWFFLNDHWLLLSFLAPFFWAIVNLVDVYFVKGIYKDEVDGMVITGLFQILPLLVIFLFFRGELGGAVNLIKSQWWQIGPILFLALLGGILFNLSFYFYFKALFKHNDVALVQIFWSMTIIAVPFLSFIFWGEQLPWFTYLGMGVTLLGATMLALNKKFHSRLSLHYFRLMFGAVLCLSLSMVFQDKVYAVLSESSLARGGFLVGFTCFAMGALVSSLWLAFYKKRNPLPIIKKYFKIFIILEGINFLGNFTSQRAIDISPTVSFVAVAETFVPVFIMGLSLVVIFVYPLFKRDDSHLTKAIYQEQLTGGWLKLAAILIMAVGVYIMN